VKWQLYMLYRTIVLYFAACRKRKGGYRNAADEIFVAARNRRRGVKKSRGAYRGGVFAARSHRHHVASAAETEANQQAWRHPFGGRYRKEEEDQKIRAGERGINSARIARRRARAK